MDSLHISRIHLIFKTHLDVGFTDYAWNVKQQYFTDFFPRARILANQLRARGGSEQFVWTTGSWILTEYLEQASPDEREQIEQAIRQGDLAYHGLPFTTHTELMDPTLFRFGQSLAQDLDHRFGKTTISAKMTDVPGHTRGLVPLLAEAGIAFLHIGVNPGATPPDVPPAFLWRDPSGAEVVVVYARGSYGHLSVLPNCPIALAFHHTLDNIGPPRTQEEVVLAIRELAAQFPGAEVIASSLDAFARDMLPYRQYLPVVTGELGDTWIHGIGSDPLKVSHYRELSRLRDAWQQTGRLTPEDPRWKPFHRALLLVPEHTWGMDEKKHLKDWTHYAPDRLEQIRHHPNVIHFASSWEEQRAYLTQAVAALGSTAEGQEAREHLQALRPRLLDTTGWEALESNGAQIATTFFTVGFDAHGSLNQLWDRQTGHDWLSGGHTIGRVAYESFSAREYERFLEQYILHPEETMVWAREDYGKPGIEHEVDAYARWEPTLVNLWKCETAEADQFALHLIMPEESRRRGAPRLWQQVLTFPKSQREMQVELSWFGKRASRLPEAIWWQFSPRIQDPTCWTMRKLGEWINPLDVVPGGNQHLHAIQDRVRYEGPEGGVELSTLDAPLIAPGHPALLTFDRARPDLSQGVQVNLYNNIWGTNFPMWYEEDACFRFHIRLSTSQ